MRNAEVTQHNAKNIMAQDAKADCVSKVGRHGAASKEGKLIHYNLN